MNIYIRTKNKIYGMIPNVVSSIEYNKDDVDGEGAYCIYYFDEDKGEHIERDELGGRSMDCVWDSDVVKTAHSIEELCDFYVFWIKDREIPIFERPIKGHRYTEKFWEECYGAIWTSKGLIYIAKMNEEGKLCLI